MGSRAGLGWLLSYTSITIMLAVAGPTGSNTGAALTGALRRVSARPSCRLGAWTHARHSHIGSAALYVPNTTTLNVLPFAPVANPARRQPVALQNARSISVQGPLGTVVVPLHEFVELDWEQQESARADAEASAAAASAAADATAEPRRLNLRVLDESDKRQRSTWGLTRALLANAIEGVQDGHSLALRLVGVGYRAAVEPDPFPRPDKFESAFSQIAESLKSTTGVAATLGNFSSSVQRDFYADLIRQAEEKTKSAGPQRLSLRLGYSHPIFMTIPRGLTCSTPQPTRIILKSADKELLGLFAAKIRKWRPPEPYKGKGVFVGDETIKLKAARKK